MVRTRGKGDVVTVVKLVSLGISAGFSKYGKIDSIDVGNSSSQHEPRTRLRKPCQPGSCLPQMKREVWEGLGRNAE